MVVLLVIHHYMIYSCTWNIYIIGDIRIENLNILLLLTQIHMIM